MTQKPFKYDPELMQKTRWIVERGLHKPREHEVERQLELPLPMPPRETEKRNDHPPTIIAGHSSPEAVVSTNPYKEMCEGSDEIFSANTGRASYFGRSVGNCSWRLDEYGNLISKMHRDFAPAQKPPVCPACGRNMKFTRLPVEQGREIGLITFECGPCRVSYTTATEEPGPRKIS